MDWQPIDSISIKSPLSGAMTGSNPTDRGKLGTKRHILTDKNGMPLSAVISSASTHDIKIVTDVWITRLSSDHHHQRNAIHPEKEDCNAYALTKRAIPRQYSRP